MQSSLGEPLHLLKIIFYSFLLVAVVLVGGIYVAYEWHNTFGPSAPVAVRPAPHFVKTFALLPGGSMDIQNRQRYTFEVRSQFPVKIISGECQVSYTVDATCENDSADLVVIDLRTMPLFSQPESNTVTVDGSAR